MITEYVPVPCPIHGRHDLTPMQAARVIVVLNAIAEELDNGTSEYDIDRDQCADNLDQVARDLSEGYGEHVSGLMAGIGVQEPLDDATAVDTRRSEG